MKKLLSAVYSSDAERFLFPLGSSMYLLQDVIYQKRSTRYFVSRTALKAQSCVFILMKHHGNLTYMALSPGITT